MKNLKGHKRKTAWLLIAALLLTIIPLGEIAPFTAHAVTVGSGIDVESVSFVQNHNGTAITDAVLQVFGTGLKDAPLFMYIGGEAIPPESQTINTDTLIKYALTPEELQGFTGRIRIGSANVMLRGVAYPVITSIPNPVVNIDILAESMVLNGTYLTHINDSEISGSYINNGIQKDISPIAGTTDSVLTFKPTSDSAPGLQDIAIIDERTSSSPSSSVSGIQTYTQYNYKSAFQVIKNLVLANVNMSPNAGSQGELIEISSDGFPSSDGYKVYFSGTDANNLPEVKASPAVTLSQDLKTLTVQVPVATQGTKSVFVVNTKNGEEITNRVPVGNFNLIDASNKPLITDVTPPSGTDSGSVVYIEGKNLIKPVFSDLATGSIVTVSGAVPSADNKSLTLNYSTEGMLYNTYPVNSITRAMKVTIGDVCTFESFSTPATTDGSDMFAVRTPSINDADVDPARDVIVEMTSTIKVNVNGTEQTYIYKQVARKADGYTFIPNSVKPVITTVSPSLIAIRSDRSIKEKTLISIEGSNFMVNKWSEGDETHINYPVVYIHTGIVPDDTYTLKFDKNGNPANTNGRIYYSDSADPPVTHILMDGSTEVPVEMVVLDSNNKVVDGSVGNEIGTRIVLYLPQQAKINATLIQNLIIQNPKRDSDELGQSSYKKDALTFVVDSSESLSVTVSPTVVTTEGGDAVTITGTTTSIQEGAKVYIDGKEVTAVTRTLNTGGEIELAFKAPAGRLGKTQVAVVNPSGSIAVRDFYYVQSINKDPKILTVAPDRGTEGTLVLIGGDNFFKPGIDVASTTGMDAYKLLGSRVLIEGVDVNDYNKNSYGEYDFIDYQSPTTDLILKSVDVQGTWTAVTADYAHSVIFYREIGGLPYYYTLSATFDGKIQLIGKQDSYTIRATGDGVFVADKDGSNQKTFSVESDGTGIVVDGQKLTMKTPYSVNSSNEIKGNHVRVISKNQIAVTIPLLASAGLKDVSVENPDTKRATKADAFTYYDSPFPQPAITSVTPNQGSVSGGYLISINGSDFESGSQVYIDGILVPAADTWTNTAGTLITVKVPKYSRNLADYSTDRITVPLVVLNTNAATASMPKGFTYISPSKEPTLTKVQLSEGSTIGGEVVELEGTNFNYFEPFKNLDGIAGYQSGGKDTFINLNPGINTTWDDISSLSNVMPLDSRLQATSFADGTHMFYTQYYASPVLPKVYFGLKEAKIVSYGKGKIVVVVPPGTAGAADVYVVNNDSGISNKLKYTYKSSNPQITYMNPTQGARTGQDNRDIYGTGFAQSTVFGYYGDNTLLDPTDPMPGVEALVRFADISNRKIALGQSNDGKIGGGEQAIVSLEGNLSMQYNGLNNEITVLLTENGKIYTRTFTGYNDTKVMIPAGMLKYNDEFYVPNNYTYNSSVYNPTTHYELFMVEVDAASGRFFVERGYAPRVEFDNATHLNLDTPSYYTIGQVNVTVTNPDGGTAITKYTYRNPATKPTIQLIKPQAKILDENAYMVEATVKGGITIEIKGHDFRDGVKVYLDKTPMEVMDITVDNTIPSDPLDVIIAKVPVGTDLNIGIRYPIIIENTDGGIANSTDPQTLTKVEADGTKWPIYFIYRKPLSDPVILTITPAESSIYVFPNTTPVHGNEITITGTDFRAGAMVIIGSIGGVPVTPHFIEDRGRIMKFYIPPNLTVGAKDIQVINTDFGTGTKTNGLKIISYPQVTGIKAGDGANAVEWVSVEGGTKIRINGSGFDAGAKVYFGGTRSQLATGDTNAVSGLWRDNNYYAVKDSTAASAVEFVDSTALTVTVPQVFKEKEFTITVINGDTGISDGDTTIKYSVPVPSTPLNLDAEIVNNKYIKLFGYTSSNFDYFEIYTFIGNKSVAKLEDNNYKDFHYLATAQTEPYKITRMEGLDEMDDKDRVFIVLKAVNKYGPSSWSNIAYLKYSEINDIKGGLGVEDFDGNMDVPAGQAFGTAVGPQQAIVTISKTDLRNMVTIPMTDSRFTAVQKTLVNIPETVVADNYNLITMQMKQGRLRFYPAILNTVRFQQISGGDQIDSYGNLSFEPVTTDYAGLIQSYVPRGMKAYSQPYRVGAAVASNAGVTELAELAGSMEVALTYLSPLPAGTNPAALQLYWYDAASSRWVVQNSALDTLNRQIYSQVARPGIYMVMGPR